MNTQAASDLSFLNAVISRAVWLKDAPQSAFDLELQRELIEWELGLCYSPSPTTAVRAVAGLDLEAGSINALNAVEV